MEPRETLRDFHKQAAPLEPTDATQKNFPSE